MTLPDLPYSEPVRLHQIAGGVKRTLEPDAAARARIVKALDLASLDSFTAEMDLAPSPAGWRLSGRVRASLAQTCGITLEPLPLEIDAYSFLLLDLSVAPPLTPSVGLLDAQGRGNVAFTLAPGATNPSFAGLTVHHAFVAFDFFFAPLFVSNAVPVELVP